MTGRAGRKGLGPAVDYAASPRVTFTSPAIASAGLTETELIRQQVACDSRVLPLAAVPRAIVARDTHGAAASAACTPSPTAPGR